MQIKRNVILDTITFSGNSLIISRTLNTPPTFQFIAAHSAITLHTQLVFTDFVAFVAGVLFF